MIFTKVGDLREFDETIFDGKIPSLKGTLNWQTVDCQPHKGHHPDLVQQTFTPICRIHYLPLLLLILLTDFNDLKVHLVGLAGNLTGE